MNLRTATSFCLSFCLAFVFLPQTWAAEAGELHTFYGVVTAVDPGAKTITIKSGGKSFVFHVRPETKISSFNSHVRLDTIQRGEAARIRMRLGERGIGVAVDIRIEHDATNAKISALYSAKTVQGENISGVAVANFVAYEPPAEGWVRGLDYGKTRGAMFLLTVQRDGTVADVKPISTLGYEELNARAMKWLKRWKFRPNSVTEVRMPIIFSQTRR